MPIVTHRNTRINAELIKSCKRKHLLYCNLYRSFLYNNSPDPSLYAPSDGLHLNFAGTDLLRKNSINIIRLPYIFLSLFTDNLLSKILADHGKKVQSTQNVYRN
jgi:hypothetical protein